MRNEVKQEQSKEKDDGKRKEKVSIEREEPLTSDTCPFYNTVPEWVNVIILASG